MIYLISLKSQTFWADKLWSTFEIFSAGLKVALSQKRPDTFFVARINIPNHYPEQKI